MKIIFSVLLLIAMPSLYSQNNLNGVITDKTTNEAIIFANVYFPQLEKGTTTCLLYTSPSPRD